MQRSHVSIANTEILSRFKPAKGISMPGFVAVVRSTDQIAVHD